MNVENRRPSRGNQRFSGYPVKWRNRGVGKQGTKSAESLFSAAPAPGTFKRDVRRDKPIHFITAGGYVPFRVLCRTSFCQSRNTAGSEAEGPRSNRPCHRPQCDPERYHGVHHSQGSLPPMMESHTEDRQARVASRWRQQRGGNLASKWRHKRYRHVRVDSKWRQQRGKI